MKKILLGAVALAALGAAPALAADLPARTYTKAPAVVTPACVWCGWYAGVNVGGGWGRETDNLVASTPDFAPLIAAGEVPLGLGIRPGGVIGGGQAGYNWQSGLWVYGLEVDIQGSGVKNSITTNSGIPPLSATSFTSDQLSWFGTVRGRVGFTPAGSFLLYGTGGLAFGQVKDSDQTFNPLFPVTGGNFQANTSSTRAGWVVGAGAEWMFMPNWSLKAEYLYMDLGNTNMTLLDTTGNFPLSSLTYQETHRYNIARVGLNYKFGGPVVAKY